MRRFLATAVIALSMLAIAPPAAQAATFECSCITPPNGTCAVAQSFNVETQAEASQLCTVACTSKGGGTIMCKVENKSVGGDRTVRLVNPLGSSSIPQLVSNIIKAAVGIVGSLALLVFVYGGFLWLTSGGEAGKVQQGKDAMKWAIIGLLVVFSSYALVSFVLSALTKVT